ncbi:Ig-like domain-containing protein [Myxococcus sp. K15C18031901]|uniref:Ig-like domain-containing protein n=1 Tax=Myxococcus dinghuensis TaxID=2906761 RepID=UPI0020A76EF8|nr:Ig-like domain-containing protein [Myxococcus dinghuensis]MCP3103439.1 Ig-like domain-containing protein [Myxococcus dinghuensis]
MRASRGRRALPRALGLALVVSTFSGCLEPGDALYPARDTDPPDVVSTDPGANGTLSVTGTLRITFSEAMDVRTLRAGIAVFSGRDEVPLTITAPPVPEVDEHVERGDVPYTVEAVPAEGSAFLPNSQYTLVLRDALTDYEGNPLAAEVRVVFRTAQ